MARMLRTGLGRAITRLSEGLADTGETMTAAGGERIVQPVAHHVGAELAVPLSATQLLINGRYLTININVSVL